MADKGRQNPYLFSWRPSAKKERGCVLLLCVLISHEDRQGLAAFGYWMAVFELIQDRQVFMSGDFGGLGGLPVALPPSNRNASPGRGGRHVPHWASFFPLFCAVFSRTLLCDPRIDYRKRPTRGKASSPATAPPKLQGLPPPPARGDRLRPRTGRAPARVGRALPAVVDLDPAQASATHVPRRIGGGDHRLRTPH